MKRLLIITLLFPLIFKGYAQDSLLIQNLNANKLEFSLSGLKKFRGSGWDSIVSEAGKNQYFLIGEVHGINEIPLFIDQLVDEVNYQSFVAEIDPYLVNILTLNISGLSDRELQHWYQRFGGNLSFYSYKDDFMLLKKLNNKNIDLVGLDQITAFNDIPVYHYLAELTNNPERQEQYQAMAVTAEKLWAEFLMSPTNTMPYLMSPQFQKNIDELNYKDIPEKELSIINKLVYSRDIYLSHGGHLRRIKLMKNELMDQYIDKFQNKKVLFRFGANHSTRGESLQFPIFDIGNLALNLAEAQLNSSYHLAILAKSGVAGNPLPGKPSIKIKPLEELQIFYELSSDDNWTYYDLRPLRKQLNTGKIDISNKLMRNTVEGYDGLIIIPEATAGEHVVKYIP